MKNSARLIFTLLLLCAGSANAQSQYQNSADFSRWAMKLREESLLKLEPLVMVPTDTNNSRYPWKHNIVTTVFWVGELAAQNNPVHNISSSWDINWRDSFGGYDNPTDRAGLPGGGSRPRTFVPKENPFYFALPYNDRSMGNYKAEAPRVIPWFKQEVQRRGGNRSVCQDRWIEIRKRIPGSNQVRICYAQWADCGPFRTDHWEYVFGNERPRPNLNSGAGLDVSPAVRDYLGISSTDVVDWRFIEWNDVPAGPWGEMGDNNHLVLAKRRNLSKGAIAKNDLPLPKRTERTADDEPTVITK